MPAVVPERFPGAKPRNVVFILADNHRYDAMSFLGHQFARTPVMDAIAADFPEPLIEDKLLNTDAN